jgi:hypothetical protein
MQEQEAAMLGRCARFAALTFVFGLALVPGAHASTHIFVGIGVGPAVAPVVPVPVPVAPVAVAPVPVYPPPYVGYVWQPGYYAWTTVGYRWVPGAWVRPTVVRRGYVAGPVVRGYWRR